MRLWLHAHGIPWCDLDHFNRGTLLRTMSLGFLTLTLMIMMMTHTDLEGLYNLFQMDTLQNGFLHVSYHSGNNLCKHTLHPWNCL